MARLPPNMAYFGTDTPEGLTMTQGGMDAESIGSANPDGTMNPAGLPPGGAPTAPSGLGAGPSDPAMQASGDAIVRDLAVRAGVPPEMVDAALATAMGGTSTTPELMQVLDAARSVAATDSEVEALAMFETRIGQGAGEFPTEDSGIDPQLGEPLGQPTGGSPGPRFRPDQPY